LVVNSWFLTSGAFSCGNITVWDEEVLTTSIRLKGYSTPYTLPVKDNSPGCENNMQGPVSEVRSSPFLDDDDDGD